EWSTYIKDIHLVLDPALDVASQSEERLSELLGTPVLRRDGKILVYAPTREHLPPAQRLESEELAEELKKTVNLWHLAIESMSNRILEKRWPLGDAIARRSFEFLEYREFDLSADEKVPFIERIRHYEKPLGEEEGPMTKALTQPLLVELADVRDYEEN